MLPALKTEIKNYISLCMVGKIHTGKRSNLQNNYKYRTHFKHVKLK